jgi:Zn-dependent protease with chaperone function
MMAAMAKVTVLVVLVALTSSARAAVRDQERERSYAADLEAQSPALAARFHQGTAAMDAQSWAEAEAALREVLARAPEHGPTLWRLSVVVGAQGRREEAIGFARRAVKARPGWQARSTLIQALLTGKPTIGELEEVDALLPAVEKEAPSEETAALATQVALLRNDRVAFRAAVNTLRARAPNGVGAHYFSAILALMEDRLEDADRELTLAEAAGFPAADAARMRELSGIERHRQVWHFARVGGVGLALWLLGLLGVYLVGATLSRRTLAAIDRFDGSASDDLRASTGALRRAYARTIGAAAIYYFVSIPVLIAIVLLGAGGVIYGFVLLGHIPIKLVLLVVLAAGVSIWAMVKSLVIRRGPDEDPGRPLVESEAPGLWALLREVAARVGTRPVEAVYLTPGTELAVMERGSMSARLRDRARRSLLLGVGVLPGFTRRQMRAVLAHEYGHFSHRDTAGGDVAMVVQASLFRSLVGIAQAGGATFYNPAWHFLRGFHALFLRVTLGASRLQEIMADHFAAVAYGAEAFRDGLTHVVRRSLEFSRNVDRLVNEAQQGQHALVNLYDAPKTAITDLEQAFAERMQDKGSPYDSHPPPGQRLAWVARVSARPDAGDDGPAWELFADRAALEAEMTALANRRLREQGIIPG